MSSPPRAQRFVTDRLWYKRAVFYQVPARGFRDANGDGHGDLNGITEKLDYLQWLGVDCIWLMPLMPSPQRDGGYDVSNFCDIDPTYGNVSDAASLIAQSHERGLRVIADMVMNHTSIDHPWFQRARRAAPGSVERGYYVWSDTRDRYTGARIIFLDTESSNWSWDEEARAYYWHRFFYHQPDLNYESTVVQEEMLNALRFWLNLGLDGFRLDAIPYLFEDEGTNCENRPRTHEFLKRVRAAVDEHGPDKVLLAEANQLPNDVRAYFGNSDECHMCFHFPVMPRLFMSLRREDASSIFEVLDETPPIPDDCQWGLFLRNHDELTLEMVSEADRQYMWAEYAADPRMKSNLGIRRRLASLVESDRDQILLLHAMLFSLPGSPVLYYGDEIGMGENIYLSDRFGVRTPMQWNRDRNGGFSSAEFAELYLPPLMDAIFGYQVINVEAQLRFPTSLLRTLRRLISLRKQHPVFGLGSYEPVRSGNRRIFSHLRRYQDDTILCVHNVARSAQFAELDLSAFAGATVTEFMGRAQFPRIGELPYLLTLEPLGWYWFALESINPSARPSGYKALQSEGGTLDERRPSRETDQTVPDVAW